MQNKVHCCATIAADLEGDHLHVGSVTGEYVQRALDRLQLGEVDGRGALGLNAQFIAHPGEYLQAGAEAGFSGFAERHGCDLVRSKRCFAHVSLSRTYCTSVAPWLVSQFGHTGHSWSVSRVPWMMLTTASRRHG